jgi:hypothetical protein
VTTRLLLLLLLPAAAGELQRDVFLWFLAKTLPKRCVPCVVVDPPYKETAPTWTMRRPKPAGLKLSSSEAAGDGLVNDARRSLMTPSLSSPWFLPLIC